MVKTETLPSGSCLPRGEEGAASSFSSLFGLVHALFPPFPFTLCIFGKQVCWHSVSSFSVFLYSPYQGFIETLTLAPWTGTNWMLLEEMGLGREHVFSFMCLNFVQIILNFYYKLLCIIEKQIKEVQKEVFIYKEGKDMRRDGQLWTNGVGKIFHDPTGKIFIVLKKPSQRKYCGVKEEHTIICKWLGKKSLLSFRFGWFL